MLPLKHIYLYILLKIVFLNLKKLYKKIMLKLITH